MNSYRYIGTDRRLAGTTAVGQIVDNLFKIQVDNPGHPWFFGWHETFREDWLEIKE